MGVDGHQLQPVSFFSRNRASMSCDMNRLCTALQKQHEVGGLFRSFGKGNMPNILLGHGVSSTQLLSKHMSC